MQLNVHVPRDREHLLRALDETARELDAPKSQVVLDAVERYLKDLARMRTSRQRSKLPTFHLGAMGTLSRAEIYEERL